jgi:uncharacterized phage protein gp47/JayE
MGLKTADEIYAELLAAFAQRAGYTPEDTCELSLRLYAAAAELQALHIQADWVLQQSFPQTAEGQYLDYLAQERGLSRTGAVQAAVFRGRRAGGGFERGGRHRVHDGGRGAL